MLRHLLIITQSGMVVFSKEFVSGLDQPRMTGNLIAAIMEAAQRTVGIPVTHMVMGNLSVTLVTDKKSGVSCALFAGSDYDYDFCSMIAAEILRVFLSDYQNTLSGQRAGPASLKVFAAFEQKIGDAIKGTIAPIVDELAAHRGVNYAFVVVDGDVIHSTTALDKLGVVANLEPLLTLGSDTLQYQGSAPVPSTIILGSERVKTVVCRNDRFCLIISCRPFTVMSGINSSIEDTRKLLTNVMKVVSGISKGSGGTVGHAGRHLYV